MRTAVKIICAAICAYALASCMAMDMAGVPDMSDMPELTYPGSVMDTEGTPIEHIKVTIEWQGAFPVKDIKYTDSNGMFYLDIINAPERYNVTLTLEDIDGEENGGLFETLTDTIILFGDPESNSTVKLDYRLNRATASESSPQS